MKIDHHSSFDRMDELSQRKVPFFFMIDFLMDNILVFNEEEFGKADVLIDFRAYKRIEENRNPPTKLQLNAFPESKASYKKGFERVQQHLKLGNSYLTNFTRKTRIETNFSLRDIFYFSDAKYKVFYQDEFVFFSPETFVEIIDNQILTYPMKGTIDASKEDAKEVLKNDPKEKAEHYTVVDLLRNDLSRVADEVKVNDFQRIDLITTQQKNLYAMSSEVAGTIKPKFRSKIGTILKTLLPAGSILGAPKPKTLEIILETEGYERGFYTGVCGWFDGKDLDSCVMIRFIEKENGKFYFKSGGGITHLSKLADEYQEMKNKIYVPVL